MRMTLAALLMATAAAPLGAQSFKFSTYADGDTAISVRRSNDGYDCTVTVRGKTLANKDAKPICAKAEASAEKARKEAELSSREARRLGEEVVATTREWTEANKHYLEELRMRSQESAANASKLRAEAERNSFFARAMPLAMGRPIIGVSIDTRPRDTDKYGAYINGVTPGGPAAKAGLLAGDIIIRIAGKSLVGGSSDDESSLPGNRLIEVVAGLTPGKAVDLQYRRGEATRTTKITPTEDEAMIVQFRGPEAARSPLAVTIPRVPMRPSSPEGFGEVRVLREGAQPSMYTFAIGGRLSDLELAPMNAKLGTYFGTSEGVLVINVPEKDNLGLQPGDVVTKVDGRDVESPSEFLRVLRSYDKGDSFKLTVTRQKRTEVVTATLP
jgi:C-terminal processing protease CtpA/Prc